ncbi:MAG: hypothetical protein ABFE07_04375, partial [Armatimonadia bacterium]
SAEAGGAMPMATAAAPAAGGPPQPVGIITGTSPMDGMFAQWADYGHENQLGLRQGYVMVHWSYMGRSQLPPEKLTDTQLKDVRTSAMNALSAGAIGVDPKALWSRLLLVETELRARRGATDIDSSWREIMSLWTSRQQTSAGYSDKILEALDRAVDGEINVLRALNDAGMRMQAAPGSGADMANRTMSAATEENPDWAGSPLSEVASLRDYLKARPHDRAADQARYLMGVMLETGPTANDMRPLTNAASEQYGKLKPMDTPPHWWRFGYGRWDRFQAN